MHAVWEMEGAHLRRRPVGGGVKPPRAALAEDRCGERRGKGSGKLSGVGIGKTNASEPLRKCREVGNDIETGVSMQSRDESGGCPLIGQAVSGMQAA